MRQLTVKQQRKIALYRMLTSYVLPHYKKKKLSSTQTDINFAEVIWDGTPNVPQLPPAQRSEHKLKYLAFLHKIAAHFFLFLRDFSKLSTNKTKFLCKSKRQELCAYDKIKLRS